MNRLLSVAKFQARDPIKAIMVFCVIRILIVLLIAAIIGHDASGDVQVDGMAVATVIFLFVHGLNSFTTGFRFTQANCVSRRTFFLANMAVLLVIALAMAAIDVTLARVFRQLIPYQGMMEQIYGTAAVLPDLVWSFACYALAAISGWMLNLVYYRSDRPQKISFSLGLLWILLILGNRNGGVVGGAIIKFSGVVLGLSGIPNPVVAAFSFMVVTVGAAVLTFQLIRRVTIKS